MVQLEFQTHSGGTVETYGCSGEQLNDEWVLTARHCIDDVARMNVYQSNDQVDRGEPIAVDSVHAAPKGDIALVHLSKEAPLSSYAEVDTTYEVLALTSSPPTTCAPQPLTSTAPQPTRSTARQLT